MKETNDSDVERALAAAREELGSLAVAAPVHYRNLTLFALSAGADFEESAGVSATTLLAEALAAGEAIVEEITEGGSVPWLAVTNSGKTPLVVPEGEVLVGAKQDRLVNLPMVVEPGRKTRVQVSCVEAGRWAYSSRRFRAGSWAHPKLRGKRTADLQERRRRGRDTGASQGLVWDEVDEHLKELKVMSPTSSMAEAARRVEERLGSYRKVLGLTEDARGVVMAGAGEILGLDLFDTPASLARVWDRLGGAYFREAAAAPEDPQFELEDMPLMEEARVSAFIDTVAEALAPARGARGEGSGIELELDAPGLAGSGLWYGGRIRQLAAFRR